MFRSRIHSMGGAGSNNTTMMPIVSKFYCSNSQTTLTIRKRPRIINGGGFVVLNSNQKLIFSVDGCGILGSKGELILRDSNGTSILFIRKKGGVVQALSAYDRYRSYLMEFGKTTKSVFSLRDPRLCFVKNKSVKISIERKGCNRDWDFEVIGSFFEKSCTINDRQGNIVAKVGFKEEMNASEDFYKVMIQAGCDQAFVVAVLAILDNIHGESTTC